MNEELRQWINVKVGSCPRLLSNTSCLCPSISGKVWIQSRMIGWCGLHFSPVSPCDCTVVSRVNTRAKIKETQQVVVVVVVVVGGTICKLSSQKAYQNHDLHQKVAFDLPAPEMSQWLCLPTRLPRKAKNMLHCCTGNEKKRSSVFGTNPGREKIPSKGERQHVTLYSLKKFNRWESKKGIVKWSSSKLGFVFGKSPAIWRPRTPKQCMVEFLFQSTPYEIYECG